MQLYVLESMCEIWHMDTFTQKKQKKTIGEKQGQAKPTPENTRKTIATHKTNKKQNQSKQKVMKKIKQPMIRTKTKQKQCHLKNM